jgi:hypothetical protein
MQFPSFPESLHGSGIAFLLTVGDIVKVREKGYSDSFSTHYIMVEATGTLDDVPFVEFTDLHVGVYSPSLRRRTVSVHDDFWAGVCPAEMEEAVDTFSTALAAASKRAMQAQAAYEEAAAEFAQYSAVADRIGNWL